MFLNIPKKFNEKGGLVIEGKYKNDKMHGLIKEYFPDGKIKSELNSVNGIAQGPYINYYQTGEIREKGNYKNDK